MTKAKPRILVLEDAADIRLIVQTTLADYHVVTATTLAEAKSKSEGEKFDLYILDIGLPDGNSFSFCEQLRSGPDGNECVILFLSGRGAEVDRLSAFKFGADDYVQKPFSPLELKARVQAHLRGLKSEQTTQTLFFPPLTIDIEKRKAFLTEGDQQKPIRLTNIEFKLLAALAARPEVVKTRQTLLDEVWGHTVTVTERSVDVHIYNLRRKLGSMAGMIEANHGNGYCFLPHVTRAA